MSMSDLILMDHVVWIPGGEWAHRLCLSRERREEEPAPAAEPSVSRWFRPKQLSMALEVKPWQEGRLEAKKRRLSGPQRMVDQAQALYICK